MRKARLQRAVGAENTAERGRTKNTCKPQPERQQVGRAVPPASRARKVIALPAVIQVAPRTVISVLIFGGG